MNDLPDTQHAVQLVGPDQLRLNEAKPVDPPGPHQVLCRVCVVGLCFSDLKLLKQFDKHVRKAPVESGVDPAVLEALPSYVPGDQPTVPGHEPVVDVVAVGEGVTRFQPGERYFIQADWRWVRTATTNGAFGYNFEGALQQYVLLDERIVISPEGESMLLPANDPSKSMAAFALVEPWACVEESYQAVERRVLATEGTCLIVSDEPLSREHVDAYFQRFGQPARVIEMRPDEVGGLDDASVDDMLVFGADADVIETLFGKAANHCLINLVTRGESFGRPVSTPLGRVHYGGIRIVGTTGACPVESMERIPERGEIRAGDHINVVGAGGPMGVMHVIRNICEGVEGVHVYAGDLNDERLEALDKLAAPRAKENGVTYRSYNAKTNPPDEAFDYAAIMAPVPMLVAQAVDQSAPGGIINIFAGIQAGVDGEIDLDAYAEKGLYFIGTSGSVLDDMKIVMGKVEKGTLDTNVSVAAVCGLDGAVEGIRAVERQEIPGKIMVYPACRGLELTPLEKLPEVLPEVADKLADGVWTREAEEALLAAY